MLLISSFHNILWDLDLVYLHMYVRLSEES